MSAAMSAAAPGGGKLLLLGTVVGPEQRLAIFQEGAHGRPLLRHEGERIGLWRVAEIRPGAVRAAGPQGETLLLVGRGGMVAAEGGSHVAALALHGQGGNEQQPE